MDSAATSTAGETIPAGIPDVRAVYRPPGAGAINKVTNRVGPVTASFIAHSPLIVVASGDGSGLDASPRGGPAGFVRVLDEQTLAFGDLQGNNRIDSYTNLQHNPSVGLLFLVPGAVETLRVNGTAVVTDDESVRQACALDGKVPRVAVVVSVQECYLHCGAALSRAKLWDPGSWTEGDRPTAGEILAEAVGGDTVVPATVDAGLRTYYETAIWNPGGAEPGAD